MSDETVTLRFDGPSAHFRMPSQDIAISKGETVDVPADETLEVVPTNRAGSADSNSENADEPVVVSLPEFLKSYTPGKFAVVSEPFDVLDKSVDDLRDALESGAFDGRLDALAHAERERNNRKTALEEIDARREEV